MDWVSLRLDFPSGVRVTLQGPAEFELIGPGETRLHSGRRTAHGARRTAHVPPAGIGFQVHTEKAQVTDLGTTFGVSVDTKGKTDVLVFEGEVEVASPSGKEKGTLIRQGAAVSVDGESGVLKPARFEPRSFGPGWEVLFGVLNTGGQIRFINAQPITNPAAVEDRENIIVFPERFGTSPKGRMSANLTKPGNYRGIDLKGRQQALDLENRKVNTYLLQYNPPHSSAVEKEEIPFVGRITFDRPILGVITDPDLLRETDGRLGKRRFVYDGRPVRGLEHGDTISLSDDRRTLGIDWLVMPALRYGKDQVRVIVDASNP